MTYRVYKSEFAESFLAWLRAKFDVLVESGLRITIDLGTVDAQLGQDIVKLIASAMYVEDEAALSRIERNIVSIAPWL
jgi:hypothetical protein